MGGGLGRQQARHIQWLSVDSHRIAMVHLHLQLADVVHRGLDLSGR